MKKHAAALLALMLAGLMGLGNAQVMQPKIAANVPFGYIANGKAMPAGECTITAQGNGTTVLWIRSGDENLLAIPHEAQSMKGSEKTVLVFHRYGDRYFLASIALQGYTRSWEFPVNKLEAELRAQNVTEKDVNLVASLH